MLHNFGVCAVKVCTNLLKTSIVTGFGPCEILLWPLQVYYRLTVTSI